MTDEFFKRPIRNSPYECPTQHWALDDTGQPTGTIVETRRKASFVTPIPKPKKRKGKAHQTELGFEEVAGLSTDGQRYDPTPIINSIRAQVGAWRAIPDPAHWQVTPETARLLQHWRHHAFGDIRLFFCQLEAVETAIWLTEVAPHSKGGRDLLEHFGAANRDANPELLRIALKLATGAGKTTVMAMLIVTHVPGPSDTSRPPA